MKKDTIIDNLIQFAAEQQRQFDAATLPRRRKEQGHFGTPPAIAGFMAGMFSEIPQGTVRILDPGAGVGTLSAAVCERMLRQKVPRRLEIELWETDPQLVTHLRKTMDRCRQSLLEFGHRLDYTICLADFILGSARKSLFTDGRAPSFHLAILNPPYSKARKESALAKAMEHVVSGQPNIYALFMAAATDHLLPGGEMVAITPRSYFSGSYFKRFRNWFIERMAPRNIHVFESRSEAFNKDEVLQENVILLAEKGGIPKEIVLTTSVGRDLHNVGKQIRAYEMVIDNSSGDRIFRIAASDLEHEIVGILDGLPNRFRTLGFEVSTGPVVTFRSTKYVIV